MMKVYQPVCPDMKLGLVADLSPDAVDISEDSTVSSDCTSCTSDDEDTRVMGAHGERPATNSHHTHPALSCNPCNRIPLSSASSVPMQVCDQHPAVTEPEGFMSELASASAQPSIFSQVRSDEAYADGTDCVDNCFHLTCQKLQISTSRFADCSSQRDRVVQYTSSTHEDEDQTSAEASDERYHGTDFGASCSTQQPVCAFDKDANSINPCTPNGQVMGDNACDDDDDDDSDGDNASIEDISISHNVPMCPPSPAPFSPARTPPMNRRVIVTGDREVGAVSTPSPLAEKPKKVKAANLHLDVHTQNSKYQSPYTLACAITPSPLLEHVSLASALSAVSDGVPLATSASVCDTGLPDGTHIDSATQSPRRVPDRGRAGSHQDEMSSSTTDAMNRSIYDEIQEALIKEVTGVGDVTLQDTDLTCDLDPAQQYPFIHKHMGHLFDKKRLLIGYASSGIRNREVSTSPSRRGYSSLARSRHVSAASTASEAATVIEENGYMNKLDDRPTSDGEEDIIRVCLEDEPEAAVSATVIYSQKRRRKNSDGDGSRRHSSSTMSTPYSDLEVTHRGMHRFIPRHADEVQIGIGDPIHVIKEFDDLWCEGVNLRSGERGIFPAMYANDLTFLEESEEEDENWKFTMRFLGTVEVTSASGDMVLCQAINKVAQQGRIRTACLCILEINQYGIRMIDKSKEGHESEKFSNFFALKNISFCGTHPNNNRYFAFITKHPREVRFACHVFHSERSTHRARDALGKAFKRFYQEYMAFTHPTEDIWME